MDNANQGQGSIVIKGYLHKISDSLEKLFI